MADRIGATVGALVFHPRDRGRILLALRGTPPFSGYWSLPGGHIDLFEPAAQAVRRELGEELGLAFVPERTRCFDEIIEEQRIHAVVQVFAGPGESAEFEVDGVEIIEARWFDRGEIGSLELAFLHNDLIRSYLEEPETWGRV